jgi:peptide methionine sulfoxide reductase MsrA
MPRRAAVQGLVTGALGLAAAFTTKNIRSSVAADTITPAAASTDLQDVYFGVGGYWHMQHEFVMAEIEKLGRSNKELTAYTGYAGGKSTDKEDFQGMADYGKLGHGEVVGMTLPANKIVEFSVLYFSLFNPITKGNEYELYEP